MVQRAAWLIGLLLALTMVFRWLEGRWSERPRTPSTADEYVNRLYWFFGPLVSDVAAASIWLYVLRPLLPAAAWSRPAQPAWVQVIEMIVVLDLLEYWMHRLFHTRWLWRWHAIHHSSIELDWLGAVRHHPGEDILARGLQFALLSLLGFDLQLLWWCFPWVMGIDLLSHANLRWTFGPLRHVLASPAFHRWHHATDAAAVDKNFAQVFPVWDYLFGTAYMPPGLRPQAFGVVSGDVPSSLAGQLLYPLQRS